MQQLSSLVYHSGALGDFITTLPALAVWRRLHPEERLVLLGVPRHAPLSPEGVFDEVWDAGDRRFAPLFGENVDPGSPLGRQFSGFRSALLFCAGSSRLPANLSFLGAREVLTQEPSPAGRVPVVDYHLSLFPDALLADEDRLPRIRRGARSLPDVPPDAVALHPGSADRRKNWPLSSFRDLAAELAGNGLRTLWILGPAEEGLAPPAGSPTLRSPALEALAAALASCRMFVGNDSGVSHLAAAVGCPTVALFGATDPAVWAPRGRRVRVVQAPGGDLSALRMETVLEGCLAFLRKG